MSSYERADEYLHEPYVKVHRNTGLNIDATGGTQNVLVGFNQSIVNTYGCWDFGNNWFRCPKAGRYSVNVNMGVFALVTARFLFEVAITGAPNPERFGLATDVQANTFSNVVASLVVQMNVNDQLTLRCVNFFGNINVGENTGGSTYTSNLAIYRIP